MKLVLFHVYRVCLTQLPLLSLFLLPSYIHSLLDSSSPSLLKVVEAWPDLIIQMHERRVIYSNLNNLNAMLIAKSTWT
jgi:hypothetical protein